MIPRIIHHVWPGRDPFREPYATWRREWEAMHPGWTFMFWREHNPQTGQPLLPPEMVPCSVTVRADLLRWWVLAEFGGVYVDTDMQPLKRLDPLLDCAPGLFLAPEPIGGVLSPALIGAKKGHPLLGDMFIAVLERVQELGADACNADPVHTTGPGLLTKVALGRSDLQIHPPYFFCPSNREFDVAYTRHHFMGSNDPRGWRNRRGKHNLGDG